MWVNAGRGKIMLEKGLVVMSQDDPGFKLN
jgi:hypothetical protein